MNLYFSTLFFLIVCYTVVRLSSVALTRSRTGRLRDLLRSGTQHAVMARLVLLRADYYILCIQVATLLLALGIGVVGTEVGLLISPTGYEALVVFLCAVLTAFFIQFFVQLFKQLALKAPEKFLCNMARTIVIMGTLLNPVIFSISCAVRIVLSLFHLTPKSERGVPASAEDISELLEESSAMGQIEEDEKEMLKGVFAFRDTVVREVMTPRSDIVHISNTASAADLVEIFAREKLSRLLITGSELDEVKGVVLAKDLLPFLGQSTDAISVSALIRPAYFVPNTKQIDNLLQEFRTQGLHFAVVLDEHGAVDGVVTLEDLIEEIVGEIIDEHDRPSEETKVRKTKSGDLIVDGAVLIEDLNSSYELQLPLGDYDTVGGLVINLFGHIPKVGEICESEGVRLRVERVRQNRVMLVRITPLRRARSNEESDIRSSEPNLP